jgi:hypothetical protein
MSKYIIIFIVVVLQPVTWLWAFVSGPLTGESRTKISGTPQPESASSKEAVSIYDSEDKRDPFMPLLTKDGRPITTYSKISSIHDVFIEGILYDPNGESVVIVNDVVLKQGGSVSGLTVKEIVKDSVTLSFKGREHIFKIKE